MCMCKSSYASVTHYGSVVPLRECWLHGIVIDPCNDFVLLCRQHGSIVYVCIYMESDEIIIMCHNYDNIMQVITIV